MILVAHPPFLRVLDVRILDEKRRHIPMFQGGQGVSININGGYFTQHNQAPPAAVHNCYDIDGAIEIIFYLRKKDEPIVLIFPGPHARSIFIVTACPSKYPRDTSRCS